MITVKHLNEEYQCDTAIRGDDYVHLLNSDGSLVASFEGICDNFQSFTIEGGNWELPPDPDECNLVAMLPGGRLVPLSKCAKDLMAYPVGSLYVSSSYANPSKKIGGTWELVDKSLAYRNYDSTVNSFWTPHRTNVDKDNTYVYVTVDDHIATFRFNITTAVDITDDDIVLGTIKFSSLGFDALAYSAIYVAGTSDGGNGIVYFRLDYATGELRSVDFNPKTSGAVIPAGSVVYALVSLPVSLETIGNLRCDKFYWKRTA